MVVPSSPNIKKQATTTTAFGGFQVPVIDLQQQQQEDSHISLSSIIVKSCEEFGFFKVINHRVPHEVVTKVEQHGSRFFSKPAWEKQQYVSKPPLGYGCKNIGFNGDMGELEYLLLLKNNLDDDRQNDQLFVNHVSNCSTPAEATSCCNFSGVINDYVHSVEDLACELLELIAKGLLGFPSTEISDLIRNKESDSLLRLNHYPKPPSSSSASIPRIGFGEHTDPQILTVLRSNDVEGLQIQRRCDKVWVSVPADTDGFYVMVGDALQVMTNGRFESVKHRVICNSDRDRLSIVYFCAPPLHATIRPLPRLLLEQSSSTTNHQTRLDDDDDDHVNSTSKQQYRAFTWAEYKTAAYSLRLGDCRLNQFKTNIAPLL